MRDPVMAPSSCANIDDPAGRYDRISARCECSGAGSTTGAPLARSRESSDPAYLTTPRRDRSRTDIQGRRIGPDRTAIHLSVPPAADLWRADLFGPGTSSTLGGWSRT